MTIGLTLRHSRRSTPSASIRKVLRCTPTTSLPYIFRLQHAEQLAQGLVGVGDERKRKALLGAETGRGCASCRAMRRAPPRSERRSGRIDPGTRCAFKCSPRYCPGIEIQITQWRSSESRMVPSVVTALKSGTGWPTVTFISVYPLIGSSTASRFRSSQIQEFLAQQGDGVLAGMPMARLTENIGVPVCGR